MPHLLRTVYFILLLSGLAATAAGQSYLYSERQLPFDALKEQTKLLLAPDGSIHVWRWGDDDAIVDVYDAQMQHRYSKNLSHKASRVLFMEYDNFYYAFILEYNKNKVFRIEGDSCVEMSTALQNVPIVQAPVTNILQGRSNMVFIQYSYNDSLQANMLHITTVDSTLKYVNTMHLKLNLSEWQIRTMKLFMLGNQLLMVNTKNDEHTTVLTIHKINTENKTVFSNAIPFTDELIMPWHIYAYGNDFILESHASRPIRGPRQQTAYTYLMRMDSSLQMVRNFYTAIDTATAAFQQLQVFIPVMTSVLPNGHLLTIDYKRSMDKNKKVSETALRFYWLDSAFNVTKNISQPVDGYTNFPAYLFNSPQQTHVYYEEQIKQYVSVLHSYAPAEGTDNDRILQLKPKFRYLIRKAVRTSDASFVMPFLNSYKLGLVKVKVATDQRYE